MNANKCEQLATGDEGSAMCAVFSRKYILCQQSAVFKYSMGENIHWPSRCDRNCNNRNTAYQIIVFVHEQLAASNLLLSAL